VIVNSWGRGKQLWNSWGAITNDYETIGEQLQMIENWSELAEVDTLNFEVGSECDFVLRISNEKNIGKRNSDFGKGGISTLTKKEKGIQILKMENISQYEKHIY